MESDSKKYPSLKEHLPLISNLLDELLPEGVGEEWIGDLDEIVYEKRREKKYSQIEIKIIYILEILPIIYSAVGYRVEKIWGIILGWIVGIVVVGLVFGLVMGCGLWLGVELLWGEGVDKIEEDIKSGRLKMKREEVWEWRVWFRVIGLFGLFIWVVLIEMVLNKKSLVEIVNDFDNEMKKEKSEDDEFGLRRLNNRLKNYR